MDSQKKPNQTIYVLIGIIVLLAGSFVFMAFGKSDNNQQPQTKTASIEELRGKQAELDLQLSEAKIKEAEARIQLTAWTNSGNVIIEQRQKIELQISDLINKPLQASGYINPNEAFQ